MKLFLFLLFVGCVTASFQDAFDKASNDAVESFKKGLEQAPALHQVLGVENNDVLQRLQRDIKEDLERYLKEAFEKTLLKIDDAVKKGKTINENALKSLSELHKKMKDLNIEEHEFDGFTDQVDAHLKTLLEKMGIVDKRSIEDNPMQSMFEDLSFRNFILRVKEMILEKMDATNLKTGISKAIGQVSKNLCEWITSRGKAKVENFFERFLETDEGPEKRSVQEYFKDLEIEFKHKLQLFREWLKNMIEKGLDESKSKIENVRSLAKKRSVQEYLEMLKIDFQKRLELFREWLKYVVEKVTDQSKGKAFSSPAEQRSVQEYLELLKHDFEERVEFFKSWLRNIVEKVLNKSKDQTEIFSSPEEQRSVQEYLEMLRIDFLKRLEFHREWLKKIIEKISGSKNENTSSLSAEKRSIEEYLEVLKKDFQERLHHFRQWLKYIEEKISGKSKVETSKAIVEKRSVQEYLEMFRKKTKSNIENVRTLALEVLRKSKDMSKEVAEEALRFLNQYKEELGYMYDIIRRRIMEKISEYTD